MTVAPMFARLHMVSKLAAFFVSYPDLAVEIGGFTERVKRSLRTASIWRSTQVNSQTPGWLPEGSRRRWAFSSPLLNIFRETERRNRRTISKVFDLSYSLGGGLTAVELWPGT